MKLKLAAVLLVLFLHQDCLYAQKEGDTWVIGYSNSPHPQFSVMHLNFSSGYMDIQWHFDERIYMIETAANICDSAGNMILYTNGMEIRGRNMQRVVDTIAYDGDKEFSYWNFWNSPSDYTYGFPEQAGALILPVPGITDEYSVLYHRQDMNDTLFFYTTTYFEARIRALNNGSYELLYKDSIISPMSDFFTGSLNACRHANGRDWWIFTLGINNGNYYSYLLDPGGIRLAEEGSIDTVVLKSIDQTVISPKGNYIARINPLNTTDGAVITVYRVNRCSGELERYVTIDSIKYGWPGIAFSPSEQFIYAPENWETLLYQWDLLAPDIEASKTYIDTFDGFVQPGWFQMRFGPMMQTPDGWIYVVPSAGSSQFMHVIERPDLPGQACKFEQHKIDLGAQNARTVPNIPNFRLGPLDGSPCDTLGLNNLPVSWWRYEEDIEGIPFDIRFTDLSYYDPDTWHWDFDDGHTSSTPAPVHTFEPGLYHVCLTVSNEYTTDSSCQWVEIMPTSTIDITVTKHDLFIDPNPFREQLSIRSRSGNYRNIDIRLFDTAGRLSFHQPAILVPSTLNFPDFLPGMYYCTITDADGSVISKPLMKLDP
jgi:hypothetical protein